MTYGKSQVKPDSITVSETIAPVVTISSGIDTA